MLELFKSMALVAPARLCYDSRMLTLQRAAKKSVVVEVLRELTEKDLSVAFDARALRPQTLSRISSRHHALARYIAEGLSCDRAALLAGYSASTVTSVLMQDPTFLELVEFYRGSNADAIRDLQKQMLDISKDAMAMIAERMETTPEKISFNQLLEVAKTTADRTGYGPKTVTETNVNVNIAARLNAAKQRLRVVEGTVNDTIHTGSDS